MKILEVGQEIKRYRKQNKLNQTEMGKLLGVCAQTISSYETGRLQPNMAIVIRFSVLSNIPVDEILFLEKYKHLLKSDFDKVINEFRSVKISDVARHPEQERSQLLKERMRKLYENMDTSVFK